LEFGGIFDENRSGCQMAWDYVYKCQRPFFIDYVADMDIRTKRLPYVEEITSSMNERKYFYTVENVENLFINMDKNLIRELREEGFEIVERNQKFINDAINNYFICKIVTPEGKFFDVITTKKFNYSLRSEIGNRLCGLEENIKVSLLWKYDKKENLLSVSLRSIDGAKYTALDIAKEYGGGGHEHASNFKVKNGNIRNIIV
jgi:hypothetical protein